MIDLYTLFHWLNGFLDYPTVILFFGVSIILTVQTGVLQLRGWPRFFRLITSGVTESRHDKKETINPFHALFTAMATTIGIGNVVGPSLAIMVGGPGALFWMIIYMFFGAVTKYAEVSFALATRKALPNGFMQGGPIQYLRSVSNLFSYWYGYLIVLVLVSWSGAQTNTLANILALEGIAHWVVGLSLAIFVFIALSGGAKRVGDVASKLVPLMFVLYVIFSFSILLREPAALWAALKEMIYAAFSPVAAAGGFVGASLFSAIREGMFRGIFICEAGLGTSSIPHALADTKTPSDQGILAMGSMVADAFLSLLSGLLVLMTGIWQIGAFRSTLLYEVFKLNSPGIGQYVLLISIILFVLTTVMGNSFNGVQSFGILVKDNKVWMRLYMAFIIACIFFGALTPMRLLWTMMDTLIVLAAIPNLIGLLVLAFRRPEVLKLQR